jgi:hypothetical protein
MRHVRIPRTHLGHVHDRACVEVARAYAQSARHLAAIGQGDFEEAHLQVSQIDALGVPRPGVPGRWVILDLV